MSAGMLFGKRTWIGVGVAMGTMMLLMLLGALLTVRGGLPMEAVSPWIWASYGIGTLIGGRVAAVGQGRELCVFVPGVLLYVLAWLLAACSECTINFSANGVGITTAVLLGIGTALVSRSKKKKRSYAGKRKRPTTKTKRR